LQPQDAYGLEKLASEELCKHYTKDFKIECRIGRFHNIYGPYGTWKGENKFLGSCTTDIGVSVFNQGWNMFDTPRHSLPVFYERTLEDLGP
jgi:nucleoside-diphosphate-sugar epimerase